MSAERSLASPAVSGWHRLDLVQEPEPRPSLRGMSIDTPGRTPAAPGLGEITPTSLDAPELYLNRELTYLNFCWRVMHEAEDDRVPLLERLKFISIVSSNIDEFFQKRIGGLKQQVGAQVHSVTPDGRTPQQQISDCLELITALEKKKVLILDKVVAELR